MPHLEPETLALAALGEPLDDDARRHLDTCAQCAAEYRSLARTVTVGRAAGPEDLVAPPERVWAAVAAELDLPAQVRPGGPTVVTAAPVEVPSAAPEPDPRDELAARRAARRPRAGWLTAAAAVAGLVVGGLGVSWWTGRTPAASVLETASLAALPDWPDASGTAVVEESSDGERTLVVSIAGAGTGEGYHEVWLIDTDVTKLVSLGVLHGDHGSFVLPDGLDLAEYPVVDVSEEPFDGNPAHSGDSIVRGILGA